MFNFHDYLPVRRQIEATYQAEEELDGKCGKPFLNRELCCLCRANPYDVTLDICRAQHTGWYLFEVMIDRYWSDLHGIFIQMVRSGILPYRQQYWASKENVEREWYVPILIKRGMYREEFRW